MITGIGNPQVKNIAALRKKPKERSRQDVFLVEGIKMFEEVPTQLLQKVYMTEAFCEKNRSRIPREILSRMGRQEGYEFVSEKVAEVMSDTKSPQGVIAVVRQPHYARKDLLGNAQKQSLILILEDLQDPGNLGTIVRSAEGAGVTGILMSSSTVDIFNPKVIRSTMGAIYRVPFLYTEHLHEDIAWLQKNHIRCYAAHLAGQHAYDQETYCEGSAFLIGNESKGLTDATASMADHYIRIPMLGQVESLNAAVAASILMYEAARQRRCQ